MEVTTMSEALQLHAQLLKLGRRHKDASRNLSNLFTFAALSPAGDLSYARLLLNSIPTLNSYYYNTLLRAYSHSPHPTHHFHALSLFLSMLHHLPLPDNFTFPFILKCCTRLKLTPYGKQLHAFIVKMGFGSDLYIQNALIHMYSEFGHLGAARALFDRMPHRDVVSWTSLIDGLVNHDRPVEAIQLFERMLEAGVEVNEATVVSVLRACADSGALSMGRKVHWIVKERGICANSNVSTALVDMYAKSGCIESARKVFDDAVDKDVFVWTAMISGLASHGQCKEAMDLFVHMEKSEVKPDEKTVTAILSACRNAGLLHDGYVFFSNVQKRYGIKPTIQHFGCLVDLLARAGRLKEAEDFVNTMPVEPDAVLWRTLIWACKVHRDAERAERLMKHLEVKEMNADDSGSYILASNVYASVGKWGSKAEVRGLMNKKGLVKPPGSSRIEVDGGVHEFVMGDYHHPEAEKIFVKLDHMVDKLRKEGYSPKVSEVLLEIDDEEKAVQLLHHSEKLALAYGLIRTNQGSTIRIVKNLRSCEDCHEFMKLISKLYQRDIIVRDRIRFHHFINGDCSCKDHW
ncbi:pentatricopeptide repeat-containing protein At4g21065-like [Abrus precatorius]|uniref:Pentatricopeptide repeat-containing protein At4g21065-like n=1 Tax=Abrus precatorius TaxID=3816 RepID=A0A8B8LMJ7_ABRPR|nr:pentatricopeptide repeat-containing protein At4g21065-like [Abrus precatorius]